VVGQEVPQLSVPMHLPVQLVGLQHVFVLLMHTPELHPPQLTGVPQLLFMVPQRPAVQGDVGTQTQVPFEHVSPWF
jgi:hypothetical protein